MFRTCRHLTPRTALLCIIGAILWLPISFGAATFLHAILLAKVASWPAWTQLLHPVATIIAKSKLLVLPVYPAAWPQARKHAWVRTTLCWMDRFAALERMRKTAHRRRQIERALGQAGDGLRRAMRSRGWPRRASRSTESAWTRGD